MTRYYNPPCVPDREAKSVSIIYELISIINTALRAFLIQRGAHIVTRAHRVVKPFATPCVTREW
ncbi:hypothetical protein BDN67DRAFT_967356 [Paxillus ammoniavirescens]|nr:hypothetical protein BDN67DRAFT_967356 [Paxillus ammoniavirescens]